MNLFNRILNSRQDFALAHLHERMELPFSMSHRMDAAGYIATLAVGVFARVSGTTRRGGLPS
jgi:hypothetical protein